LNFQLLAKLLATLLKKNESVERIPHSLETSVSQHIVPMRCIITLFQKYMQKVSAVISCFWRICDLRVSAVRNLYR